eukprot:CAMPEP_0175750284 /NCGR_PEP_ID=MMETSP0097-20121207/60598_1 /TAXON_ID=311494 /ORGANISM="Alexandrium monilatum, Strain CCMP3105" /LENGTH=102 /DNA_ID=CAMNT_0017058889 /DNA_START=21 /DNA_END=325 /DNA_ORIENTATION=+
MQGAAMAEVQDPAGGLPQWVLDELCVGDEGRAEGAESPRSPVDAELQRAKRKRRRPDEEPRGEERRGEAAAPPREAQPDPPPSQLPAQKRVRFGSAEAGPRT